MGVVLVALVLVDGQAVVVVAAGDFVGRLICRVDQVVGGIKGKAFVAGLGQAAKRVIAVVNGLLDWTRNLNVPVTKIKIGVNVY